MCIKLIILLILGEICQLYIHTICNTHSTCLHVKLNESVSITVGCYDYPTYYDPASDQCVETCPSGTIGVVNGSVNDVTTDRARACVQS